MLASWNNFKDLYTLEHGQKKKGGIIFKIFVFCNMDRKKGGQLFPRALYFGLWTEKRGLDDYFQNLYTLVMNTIMDVKFVIFKSDLLFLREDPLNIKTISP